MISLLSLDCMAHFEVGYCVPESLFTDKPFVHLKCMLQLFEVCGILIIVFDITSMIILMADVALEDGIYDMFSSTWIKQDLHTCAVKLSMLLLILFAFWPEVSVWFMSGTGDNLINTAWTVLQSICISITVVYDLPLEWQLGTVHPPVNGFLPFIGFWAMMAWRHDWGISPLSFPDIMAFILTINIRKKQCLSSQ